MAVKPERIALDLIDHNGNAFTAAQLASGLTLCYFGFLHCRAVCPRSLAKLNEILQLLGPRQRQVKVLYISVDPARDTPEAMKSFLAENYPAFTGLTGTQAAIDMAKASMNVFTRQTNDPEDPEGYAVPHTALIYLVDGTGAYLTHFADHLTAQDIANRLESYIE
ncbi:MAG: SCO family protein [Pseudomonadota bacterium]